MVDYTPAHSLPYPAATDSVRPETRDFQNLAIATEAALTTLGASKLSVVRDTIEDLNTLVEPGLYGFWGSNANTPTGSSGTLIVGAIGANVTHFAYNFTSGVIAKRSRSAAGTWQPWDILVQKDRPWVGDVGINNLDNLVKEGTWSLRLGDTTTGRPVEGVNAILDMTWYRDNAWVQTWRTIMDDYSIWQRRTINSGSTWSEWERIATTKRTGMTPPMLSESTSVTNLDDFVEDGDWYIRQTETFANQPPGTTGKTARFEMRMYRPNAWTQTWKTVMNGDYEVWQRHTINNGTAWYDWTRVGGSGGGASGGNWTPTDSVYFWGDSSVKGGSGSEPTWPVGTALWERLGGVLTNPVLNRATGGYTAANVLLTAGIMRLNARPIGGTIPASGSVFVDIEEWFPTSGTFGMACNWAGVPGFLRRQTDGQWRFDRTGTGSTVNVTSNTEIVSTEKMDQFSGTHIFMMAGNNWATRDDYNGVDWGNAADHVVATYLRAVDAVHADGERHVLIAGVKSRQNTAIGSTGHAWVQEINARLHEEAPAHFVSRHDWLVHNSLRALGLTPTAADTERMNAGLIPERAFDDVTHIKRGVVLVEARELWMPELARRGWAQPNTNGQGILDGLTFPARPYVPDAGLDATAALAAYLTAIA